MTETKHISLPDDLAEFVEDENIALSGFVQDKLRQKKERKEKLEEADIEELA